MPQWVVLCAWFFSGSLAQARVFDFKNEHFAVYVGGSFGNSNLGTGAFSPATPSDISYDKTVQSNASGEFGFVFSATKFNLKLGAEYLMPRVQTAANATDASGAQLFALTSQVTALVPMAVLEIMPYRGVLSRAIIGAGYGYAMVSLSNQYTMTTTGESRFGVGDYQESGSGTASMILAYAGWEFLFTDTTTLMFQAGYRYCKVNTITASQNANAIPGTQTSGQEILNYDGSHRTIDLGGGFVGLSLRFYL